MVQSLDFLGYNVSSEGIKPTDKKLEELNSFPCPTNSKNLRSFLGMIGFYRRLVPHFADIVHPLTECMRLNPNSKSLILSETEKDSFNKIKDTLVNIACLPHPQNAVTEYQLVTDSSQYAIGAALHQMVDNKPIPIGFYSKKLSKPQQSYSAFDRELLAAYLSVIHFKHEIEGRYVVLLSDHKPLCNAFHSLKESKSDRQQRHLALLTEYLADAIHIKGSQNVVADCLSRPANAVLIDICDLPEISRLQKEDEEITNYKDKLSEYSYKGGSCGILCDVSTPYPRPFIVSSLRRSIFDSLHNLTHCGIKPTLTLIKSRYFWPNMDHDIRQMCRECLACQQSKITRHTHSPVQHFTLPSPRFQTVHIDIVGPLKRVKNPDDDNASPYRYLLTCIDRNTRWIEAETLSDITAQTVARAFFNVWISRFGVPLHLITDRGTQFESELFSNLSKIIGFLRLRTTSYHPQSNGIVERMHRTLKTALMARKENWITSLPVVLYGLRAIKNESGLSPFNAVTGTDILIPSRLISKDNEELTECDKTVSDLSKEMKLLD